LDDKSLSDVRKVQIVVEFGGGQDFADFDATVIGWVQRTKSGCWRSLKYRAMS